MKYRYAYKDSKGIRHEDSMDADSRDHVFEALRERGIKAIKVVASDGSKSNGEIRGIRITVAAVICVSFALVVGAVAFFGGRKTIQPPKAPLFEVEQTRRQVIGDAAIIDKGIATGWADVFHSEGDRFFASFAIPGVKAGQRNTTIEELNASLQRAVKATKDDGMEARQIKSMVEGMKAEARAYIAAGGDIATYGKRLTERQDAEIAIYERAKNDLAKAKETKSISEFMSLWEETNNQLRNLGIKLVPLED